jgi:tripeptide aminopeptidase
VPAGELILNLILRDFEVAGLDAQGRLLKGLAERLQAQHPRASIDVKIEKQYRNMRYGLEKDMRPIRVEGPRCPCPTGMAASARHSQ